MVNNFLHTLAVFAGLIIILPVLLGSILVAISRANKSASVLLSGFYGQIIFGGIGVIIHEMSHLILAVIFGHHIQSVSLLHIPNSHDPRDRGLGYVGHTWNDDNLYQKIGNVFIGIAPVIGCSLAMIWSTRLLVPSFYNQWMVAIGGHQITEHPIAWWQWGLWIVLMINISIGGFDLSASDLQNSRHGIMALIIVITLAACLSSLIMNYQTIYAKLSQIIGPLMWMLVFAIAINAGLWLIMRIGVRLRSR